METETKVIPSKTVIANVQSKVTEVPSYIYTKSAIPVVYTTYSASPYTTYETSTISKCETKTGWN